MAKRKTTRERGRFKQEIHAALYKNEDLRSLLVGNFSNMTKQQMVSEFKRHVKSHLFVDETVTETASFIFYDVAFPSLKEHTKDCKVIMYIICHRDIVENCQVEGYVGDRVDILCQMVEDALLNNEDVVGDFGIGDLQLDNIQIYNATRFYGAILNFSVPAFRWC